MQQERSGAFLVLLSIDIPPVDCRFLLLLLLLFVFVFTFLCLLLICFLFLFVLLFIPFFIELG
jgi:hypothetical protein